MGRQRRNLIYGYFDYDKENNSSKCCMESCGQTMKGYHGSNLLRHFFAHHRATYDDVIKKNKEMTLARILDDSSEDSTVPMKIELQETKEAEEDPLESEDDHEPTPKRERKSYKIELARPSSSQTPEKHTEAISSSPHRTEDKFELFGKSVSAKLRDIALADDKQRLLAEKIINDALFYGEMGQLTLAHCNRLHPD